MHPGIRKLVLITATAFVALIVVALASFSVSEKRQRDADVAIGLAPPLQAVNPTFTPAQENHTGETLVVFNDGLGPGYTPLALYSASDVEMWMMHQGGSFPAPVGGNQESSVSLNLRQSGKILPIEPGTSVKVLSLDLHHEIANVEVLSGDYSGKCGFIFSGDLFRVGRDPNPTPAFPSRSRVYQ